MTDGWKDRSSGYRLIGDKAVLFLCAVRHDIANAIANCNEDFVLGGMSP
jgi:hypothetical protein